VTTTLEDKIVRDGERVRVPLWLMDSLQRSVRAHAVQDGFGKPAGQRPGFVYVAGLDNAPCRDAYEGYEQFLSDAWKADNAGATGNENPPANAYSAYVDQLGDAWRAK
jgi:hypothetical protein